MFRCLVQYWCQSQYELRGNCGDESWIKSGIRGGGNSDSDYGTELGSRNIGREGRLVPMVTMCVAESSPALVREASRALSDAASPEPSDEVGLRASAPLCLVMYFRVNFAESVGDCVDGRG